MSAKLAGKVAVPRRLPSEPSALERSGKFPFSGVLSFARVEAAYLKRVTLHRVIYADVDSSGGSSFTQGFMPGRKDIHR